VANFDNIKFSSHNYGLGDAEEFANIENQIKRGDGMFDQIDEVQRDDSPTKQTRSIQEKELAIVSARKASPEKQEPSHLDWSEYELTFPEQYHNDSKANTTVKNEVRGHDGKLQRVYENNKKEVIFTNKVRRETFPDGYTIVYFNNNDIKQTYPDQRIVYFFNEAETTQTTYRDGMQVFKFANKQIEKHHIDGTKEIR